MKVNKIAIFLPTTNPFYVAMIFALQRAFESIGVKVSGWPCLLEEPELMEFVRQYQPDVIIEMNRSRQQIPFLPREIKHVAWMVDVADFPYNKISDSDIIYFFGANWLRNYPYKNRYNTKWLAPGACPDNFFYEKQSYLSDISFIGHIPLPWTQEEMSRIIYNDHKNKFNFGQLYEICQQSWIVENLKNYDNESYLQSALKKALEITGEKAEVSEQKLRYDIACKSVRLINRIKTMRLALKVSSSIRIWGSPNWIQYPDFSSFYKKPIYNSANIRTAYQSSKLNLHEGVGLHFRTFECMASGGCLLYFRSPDDDSYGGINTFFEPGVHYFPFDNNDYQEIPEKYINAEEKLMKVSLQASQIIKEKHTWRHRALQIIEDLKRI